MQYTSKDHTFVICAYKESPYLRECIESLVAQKTPSNLMMATSTDCEFIRNMAKEYNIPLFVNEGEGGIANDWNFAYDCAKTPLVTLAHQDDRYDAYYVEEMLRVVNKTRNPRIFFANYNEIRNGVEVSKSTMLTVKRIMLLPMRIPAFRGIKFFKRMSISMGNPVACWSVCYVKDNFESPVYVSEYRSNLDWEEWEKLSRQPGAFAYSNRVLTYHRVHEGSETSNTISEGNIRAKEDYDMFRKFWPKWLADFIMKFYINAEKYNEASNT